MLITKTNDTTNISLIFARVWNLVPHPNGRTQAGSVWGQCADGIVLCRHYWEDKMEEDEIHVTCSMHEKCAQNLDQKSW